MQVAKWGNSLAIRLPASVVSILGLEEGDDIEVIVAEDGALAVRRKLNRREALDRLKKFRGKLPADFKFDREEANAR